MVKSLTFKGMVLGLIWLLAGMEEAFSASRCEELIDKHTLLINVNPGADLSLEVKNAASGSTLLLSPGTYKIATMVQFTKSNVTLRSKTGNREDVILEGNGGSVPLNSANFIPEILAIRASNVTIADISIRHARHHAVHVFPASGTSSSGFIMHNVHVYDCGEQLVKVNSNGETSPGWANSGIVECSLLEFIDNSIMEPWSGGGFYTGGIDVHGGENWIIRYNDFRNIQKDGQLMEHAVHFWTKSRGTLVEYNRFENNYRAIGFGMKTSPNGLDRKYSDGKGDAPYFDHLDGIIRNNIIFNGKGIHLESGIELLNVTGTEVYHNSIYSFNTPFSGIEYRFANTKVTLKNNLLGHKVVKRDGAVAEVAGNLENSSATTFLDVESGDLHLAKLAGANPAVNHAEVLPVLKSGFDFDGFSRGSQPDIGAYELNEGLRIFPKRLKNSPRRSTQLVLHYDQAGQNEPMPGFISPTPFRFFNSLGQNFWLK